MSNYNTKVSRLNEPIQKGDPILSSHNYVWLRLREEDPRTGEKYPEARVRLHSPRNCEHGTAMCEECVDTWTLDYHVFFNRTVGGRRVLTRATALGKEVKMP